MVTKIHDLKVNDVQKMILTVVGSRADINTYDICAKTGKSYASVSQNLGILIAKGYVKKHKSMRGKNFYALDKGVEA